MKDIFFLPSFLLSAPVMAFLKNFKANRLVTLWLNIFYQRRGDFSSPKPYTENFLSERDLEMILEQCSFRK